jgi:tRNA threonylcarbamoyladenosine biosynthesis protein TsaE
VEELAIRDLTGPGSLMLIEWPEKGGGVIPAADLIVALDYAEEARRVAVSGRSALGRDWEVKLLHDTSLKPYVSNLT